MVKRRRRREFTRRPVYGMANRPNSLIKIFFIVVVVVLLVAGGYYGYPLIKNWMSGGSSQMEGEDSLSVQDLTSKSEEVASSEEVKVPTKQEPPAPVEPVNKYQVEVLNGTGIKGLAQKLTDSLRAHGFDVVKTANFESRDVSESFVINRSGKDEAAKRIAELLGIKKMVPQTTPDLMLDVTVVLGHDFRKLTVFRK